MSFSFVLCLFFFFNDTATTEIYTLSLHDALPILPAFVGASSSGPDRTRTLVLRQDDGGTRSEEHTSELQSSRELVCRLLLEKKKTKRILSPHQSTQKNNTIHKHKTHKN